MILLFSWQFWLRKTGNVSYINSSLNIKLLQNQNSRTRIQNANSPKNTQTSEERSWGAVRNSQSNFEDLPDPPMYYRSLSLVGGDFCDSIRNRNKMSMMKLWQTSCEPSTPDFRNEMSARNPFMKKYADLGLSNICAIIDSNNLPKELLSYELRRRQPRRLAAGMYNP